MTRIPTPLGARGRRTTGLLAGLALGASAITCVAATTTTATAAPAGCEQPVDVSTLTEGQAVHGLTVTKGTVPDPFTGEVLGVAEDGIAPGLDMVMVKVDPASIPNIDKDEVKGIWQGMSGSPVYDGDGGLIGAVAYGLSWQQSWVAGVTPYSEMDDYLTSPAAPTKLTVSKSAARAVARGTSLSVEQATGWKALPMPLSVAGAGSRVARPASARVGEAPTWLASSAQAVGKASAALDRGSIQPGGNLAASLAHGDILMAGVGTVTSVCGDEVVGFGHPMTFSGDTTMALHPASAIYIQGDAPSFKVANIGDPVGVISGDHMAGITGALGLDKVPAGTSVSASAQKGAAAARQGSSTATVRTPDVLASTAFYQVSSVQDRALDAYMPGSEIMGWTVAGTGPDGAPFSFEWLDRYTSRWDLSAEVGYSVGDLVYGLSSIPGVTITEVTSEASGLSSDISSYKLTQVQQKRDGGWAKVGRRSPVVAKSGGTLHLRALLEKSDGSTTTVPFTFAVPRGNAGKLGYLQMFGGGSSYFYPGDSIAKVRKQLAESVRHDAVKASLGKYTSRGDYYFEEFRTTTSDRGCRGCGGGGRVVKFSKSESSAPQDAVVTGSRTFLVRFH